MTAVELIDETVEFYGGDPDGRRSVGLERSRGPVIACMYKMRTPQGGVLMCAVGRCMENPPEELECAADFLAAKLGAASLDDLLRPEYRGFPVSLWLGIQQLHDCNVAWRKSASGGGLTELGSQKVNRLKKKHGLA